ncbi:SulP family inorganic anion transporter [Bacillus solitudinis]|uniref:SulP family inorganic anion transporter n=1 Tax=Bacillus solitudinis TaxID=2014074 RepID=UPI000C24AFB0|nr:SulP family inorganic anion transporter [Bacillus solitudinis]
MMSSIRNSWFSNIRGDMLAGITVALALIPEAIAFSIIAGVDPMVGLYASFLIPVIIAFVGGRPGMISAATGAMALLMITLVADYGIEYLFAATILTGLIQIMLGVFKTGSLILSFIPNSVIIGFLNALAILIFMAQLPYFVGESLNMYVMVAVTLLIIYLLPRLTRAIPSSLVALVGLTAFSIFTGMNIQTIGDIGPITSTLPVFIIPNIPFSFETFMIVLPYAITLSLVGLLESLLTATIVDDMTDTPSSKNKEVRGQGIANFVTGFFGGMAGCAMIGQSIINVKSGGKGRLSSLTAGIVLIVLIIMFGEIVAQIPMAALVGVMIMVSIGTFHWQSIIDIRKMPKSEALVIMITVAIVIVTHDLAQGVLAGVLVSALTFVWKIAKIKVGTSTEGNKKTYRISGQLFFGSTTLFLEQFKYDEDPNHIVIDMEFAQVWDHSGVIALAKVINKYEDSGKKVELIRLSKESQLIISRLGLASTGAH